MVRLILFLMTAGLLYGVVSYNMKLQTSLLATTPITGNKTNSALATESNTQNGEKQASERIRRIEKGLVASLKRPLFSPTRRPFVPPPKIERKVVPVPAPKPVEPVAKKEKPKLVVPKKEKVLPPKKPILSLLGTASSPLGSKALLSVEGGQPKWTKISEKVGSWVVSEIKTNRITLTNGKHRASYTLFDELEIGRSTN